MELLQKIRSYVNEIQAIDTYFRETYLVTNVLEAIRHKIIPSDGVIFEGEYYFHGIGCRVIFPNRVINYDYSPINIAGGFGLFDLFDYLKSIGEKYEHHYIEQKLHNLVQTGELIYPELPPNKSLYYLKSYENKLIKY